MANTYNPYSDIKSIYDLKGQWDEANKAGNANKKNQIAATAQAYYDKLKNNDYSGVAQALGASGYQDAKKILDSYSPTKGYAYSAPDSTSLTNPELITTNNNEVRNKINQSWGNQTSDRETMMNKYNKLEDTAYSNPFDTDEAKAILAKYDLSGLQARDNAVASGSASNGGNIDSYAASNALRQQAALVNQGQMAVLESHNNRINNVQNTLEKLGVYLQNQDKGMQNTITLQSNEGQRLFENEETAKNNETARLVEQANVTGYTPTEWTIKNDDIYSQFLNTDGTFKSEKENIDIQALINTAKANGDTETAKKLAVVRARKIFGNYGEFGQYANSGDISSMTPQITEARRESEQNNATVLKTLEEETGLAKHEIDTKKAISDSTLATEKAIADAANQNALDQIELTALYSQAATGQFTDEMKKKTVDSLNSKFKDAIKGDIVSQVGDKYVINGGYGGAVARYLMQVLDNPDGVADIMYQMFGTSKDDVKEALSKASVYDWEDNYNPTNDTPPYKAFSPNFSNELK